MKATKEFTGKFPRVIYIPDHEEEVREFYENIDYINLVSVLDEEDIQILEDLCQCACDTFYERDIKKYCFRGVTYNKAQIKFKLLHLRPEDIICIIDKLKGYVINVSDKNEVYLPLMCNKFFIWN